MSRACGTELTANDNPVSKLSGARVNPVIRLWVKMMLIHSYHHPQFYPKLIDRAEEGFSTGLSLLCLIGLYAFIQARRCPA